MRYDKGGIFGLKAENLYVVGDELEKMNIITPQAAIDVYVKEYSKAIHFDVFAFSIDQLKRYQIYHFQLTSLFA